MRDVASTAGVSLKTVSRVVNSEDGVRPATAARVEAAIAHLGFARNDVARSLRHGRANALGLVIEDVANPFYSAIARTVEDAAHARSHILITGSCEEDAERERELVLRLLRRSVDALLIVPAGDDHRYLLPEIGAGTPIVFLDRPPRGVEADTVLLDNLGGARAGGRAPAAPRARADRLRRRHAAALHRRRAPGRLPRRAARRRPAPRRGPGQRRLARRRVRRAGGRARCSRCPPTAGPRRSSPPTTATPSARCARCATATGPIALVGFDDFELADMLPVPGHGRAATTPREMGRIGAEMAYERLDGEDGPPQRRTIDCAVVARGSGELPAP